METGRYYLNARTCTQIERLNALLSAIEEKANESLPADVAMPYVWKNNTPQEVIDWACQSMIERCKDTLRDMDAKPQGNQP